jgi:branched-subunit amino acid ABC-type transport system permease component
VDIVVASIGFGLVTASVLAIAAVGATLQFGVTNYVNFAYGEFMTLGAYVAWFANTQLGINIWVSMAIGGFVVAATALVISRLVLDFFAKRRTTNLFLLIITFGIGLILANLMLAVFGSDFRRFDRPHQTLVGIGPWAFTPDQLGIMLVGLTAMVGIHFLLRRTTLGKSMRAMSDNPLLAEVSGIDTDRVTAWVWVISGFLAGVAGVVLALNAASFEASLGGTFLLVVFAAVILGGIGKPYGAMLGALAIGLTTEIAASILNPAYKNDIAFLVLIVMILVRPQGLLAARGRTA